MDDFDIVADCEYDPSPDCIDCKLALNSMNLLDNSSLSMKEKSLLESAIHCSSFDCLVDNSELLESVLELLNSDVSDPCDESKSTSDIINDALSASSENCGLEAFENEMAKKGSVIKPEGFAEDCPCLNTILDNLLNVQDENWYCDLIRDLDESERLTTTIVLSDVDGFKTNPP